jgi:peptide-methionine (S)-S-oxide reductase
MSSNRGFGNRNDSREAATLAGGCFWCLEAIFDELEGVEKVVSGYSGGKTANPSYKEVCGGRTGHAEAVQVVFDPKVISYREILALFFSMHDPTTLNRQGADVGTQYRSVIFYHNDKQKAIAEQLIKELNAAKIWNAPIVTEVTPFSAFYPAEDYHQNYFKQNASQSYCQVVIAPKLAKFRKHYSDKLKNKR